MEKCVTYKYAIRFLRGGRTCMQVFATVHVCLARIAVLQGQTQLSSYQRFFARQALGWIDAQQLLDKVFCIWGDIIPNLCEDTVAL